MPPPAAQKRKTNISSSNISAVPSPEKKRRYLSAKKKFLLYLEAQDGSKPVGELLRREGLFSTDLARIQQQVKWAGKVPCYPGLGVSASSTRFGADRAIEEINLARRY